MSNYKTEYGNDLLKTNTEIKFELKNDDIIRNTYITSESSVKYSWLIIRYWISVLIIKAILLLYLKFRIN